MGSTYSCVTLPSAIEENEVDRASVDPINACSPGSGHQLELRTPCADAPHEVRQKREQNLTGFRGCNESQFSGIWPKEGSVGAP